MTTNIDATLQERGKRYGSFKEHARIAQAIKKAMRDSPNWESLPDDMKETLEMNAHKTARILNGDPFYHDSWHDINGYTKLVADEILKEEKQQVEKDEEPKPISPIEYLRNHLHDKGVIPDQIESKTKVNVHTLLEGSQDFSLTDCEKLDDYFGLDKFTFIKVRDKYDYYMKRHQKKQKGYIEITGGGGGYGSSAPTPDSQPNMPPPPSKK